MTWQNERKLRHKIAEIHRRLYDLGFSVANDGNTSVRLERNRILITPSGLDKARLEPDQMAMVDTEGTPISGRFPPSSEIAMHVQIFKARPDVDAVIHAHPPYCIACSLAGVSLEDDLLPEVILTLGKIPTARYVTPGTREVGTVVADLITQHDALILARHGIVTVGNSLDDAMLKLERSEHTAKIVSIAKAMGAVTPLPQPEIDRLRNTGADPKAKPDVPTLGDDRAKLIELITREVTEALARSEQKS